MSRYTGVLTAAAITTMAATATMTGSAFAQGAQQTISAVDVKAVAAGYRASKITGSTVVDDKNDSIGKVDDLVVTTQPVAVYAVLSVGGFLGLDSKLVAVRYDQLRVDSQHKGYVLIGATKDSLKALPEFEYAK